MYSLSVADGIADVDNIVELMNKVDPDGTHRLAGGTREARRIIDSEHPEVVWLAPNENGFALAEQGRKISPLTNFIFVAENGEKAYQAMKVRASGYALSPVSEAVIREELDALRYPVSRVEAILKVQCFGNFEVFREGKIVKFSRSLSKEALAYMVDRKGAGCSVSEICSVLWENRPIDTSLKSQCRVILASLRKDLEAAGAGDVLVKDWNVWGIDADKIDCDYYDYIHGEGKTLDGSYRGEYMAQYSWAELTGGSLYQMASE